MVLSHEREAEIIEQNMPTIRKIVSNFMAKNPNPPVRVAREDFIQEVTLMYLQYIRQCDSEEKLNHFPVYSAKNVMTKLIMAHQPVSVPKRTNGFKEVLENIKTPIPFEIMTDNFIVANGLSKNWVPDTEAAVDLDAFMSKFDYRTKEIMDLWLHGYTLREIGLVYNISYQSVQRIIKRFITQYAKFRRGG